MERILEPEVMDTPEEAAAKKTLVEKEAEAVGRSMDPEHFGINLAYRRGPLPDAAREQLTRRRADFDVDRAIPEGRDALRRRIDEWVDAGFSKFLLRPIAPPDDWTAELEQLADEVLDLQT